MVDKVRGSLQGKKTYIALAAWIALGLLGDFELVTPETVDQLQEYCLGAAGIAAAAKMNRKLNNE